jgi:hypothetical protein
MARRKKNEENFVDPMTEEEMKDYVATNTDTEEDTKVDPAEDVVYVEHPDEYDPTEETLLNSGWLGNYIEKEPEPEVAGWDDEVEYTLEESLYAENERYRVALRGILKKVDGSLDHRFVAINRIASNALHGD